MHFLIISANGNLSSSRFRINYSAPITPAACPTETYIVRLSSIFLFNSRISGGVHSPDHAPIIQKADRNKTCQLFSLFIYHILHTSQHISCRIIFINFLLYSITTLFFYEQQTNQFDIFRFFSFTTPKNECILSIVKTAYGSFSQKERRMVPI